MTADGSEDHLKPEGLKDYVVLPPSLLEPSTYAVASNEPPLDTSEADDDDMTEIAAEFGLCEEFIHQDAGDSIMEERNVFDIIDGLLLISE